MKLNIINILRTGARACACACARVRVRALVRGRGCALVRVCCVHMNACARACVWRANVLARVCVCVCLFVCVSVSVSVSMFPRLGSSADTILLGQQCYPWVCAND